MKYILVYRISTFIGNCIKKEFKTLEEVETYLNKNSITKTDIIYLGENKPLKIEINVS